MKKFMRTALSLVMIAACLATTALAADPTVTYSGNSGNFVFAPEDLFADFKGVMPGDTLTEQIEVKNNANNKVDVKIYIRALGATVHLRQLDGKNTHHILEAVFKGMGRTMKEAVAVDPALAGALPSTKGLL